MNIMVKLVAISTSTVVQVAVTTFTSTHKKEQKAIKGKDWLFTSYTKVKEKEIKYKAVVTFSRNNYFFIS